MNIEDESIVDTPWGEVTLNDDNRSYEDVDMTETLVEIFALKYKLQNMDRGVV